MQQLEQVFTCHLQADRQTDRQKGEELKTDRQKDVNSTLPAVRRQLRDTRPNSSTLFPPPLVLQELQETCVRVWLPVVGRLSQSREQ